MGKRLENLKRSDSREGIPSTSNGIFKKDSSKPDKKLCNNQQQSSPSSFGASVTKQCPGIFRSTSTSHLSTERVYLQPRSKVDIKSSPSSSLTSTSSATTNVDVSGSKANTTYDETNGAAATGRPNNQRKTNFPYAFLRSRLGPVPEEEHVREKHTSKTSEKSVLLRVVSQDQIDAFSENGSHNVWSPLPPSTIKNSQRHARSASFSNGQLLQDDDVVDNYIYMNCIRSDESGYESDGTRTGTDSPHDTPRKERLKSGDSSSRNIFNYEVFDPNETNFNDVSYVKFEEPDYNEYSSSSPSHLNLGIVNNYESWTLDRKFRKDKAKQREARVTSMYHSNQLQSPTDEVFLDSNHAIQWSYDDRVEHPHYLNRQTFSCWDIPVVAAQQPSDTLVSIDDTNRSFVLIRLEKDCSGELGIFITSQTDDNTGTRGYVIAHIEKGGLAEKNGRLREGDELVNVNGKRLRGLTLEEARNTLKSTPKDVALVILRKLSQEVPSNNSGQQVEKELMNSRRGGVRTNRLMSVQSFEVDNPSSYSHEKVSENGLCTLPRRPKSSQLTIHTVVFEKGAGKKSLGFSIVGGRDSPKGQMGIYVKTVFPSGQAAIDGSLQEGDEIFTVNGMVMQGLSHSEAIAVFKTIKQGQIVLHVGRRSAPVKKTTALSKSCNDLENLE